MVIPRDRVSFIPAIRLGDLLVGLGEVHGRRQLGHRERLARGRHLGVPPAGVVLLEVGDQLGREPAAGLADQVAWPYPCQQRLGLSRGEVLLRPTGQELEQQGVQLGHLAGVVVTECAAAVGQHPQHRELVVGDHWTQPGHPGPDQRHRMRVRGVGLATLPGGEHPGSRRELRRHVDDVLVVGQEPHRDVPADAVAPFDRPDPVRPLLHVLGHRVEAVDVGAKPAAAKDLLAGGHHLDRDRPLVRVHPDHDPFTLCTSSSR
jgi:hypothetical protein